MTHEYLYDFVKESNAIEQIYREPSQAEIDELKRFIELPKVSIDDLSKFVSVYQPDAKLRCEYGMNVRIGKYIPPMSGPHMTQKLQELLDKNLSAFGLHIEYEMLHPFTDGNGRSGRALWLWRYKNSPEFSWKHKDIFKGFLDNFYMQTLQHFSKGR